MQLRLWWWRKVRYAVIPKESRDIFERFGDSIIGNVVTGFAGQRVAELDLICTDPQRREEATAWLTERGDLRELHEQRLETAEWAILVFVLLGVILDVVLVIQGLK
jgi:hypothetical protein